MSRRIGPRMAQVVRFVEENPGLRAKQAAAHVGPHGSVSFGYATVHRAIAAGLIRAEKTISGAIFLFPLGDLERFVKEVLG